MDRFDRQDYAERWLSDAFRVIQENPPGFLVYVDIEMTRVQALIAELRRVGIRGSFGAVLVRAAGLALARNPDLHQLLSGSRRLHPERVDIGLSVANEAVAAPVMRLLGSMTEWAAALIGSSPGSGPSHRCWRGRRRQQRG